MLVGHERFGQQFGQNTPFRASVEPSNQDFGVSSGEDLGRFGDPDAGFGANPIDSNEDLNRQEPPKMPPPLQINREAPEMQQFQDETVSPTSPNKYGVQSARRQFEFPNPGTNAPAKVTDYPSSSGKTASGPIEQRLIDEIEDIKAQNNEILRRLQRLEAKMR